MPLVTTTEIAHWWSVVRFAVVIPVAVMVTMVVMVTGRLPVLNRRSPHDDGRWRVHAGLVGWVRGVHRVSRCGVAPGNAGTDQATSSCAHQSPVGSAD